MKIEVVYDEKTTAIIDHLMNVLKEYSELLTKKINNGPPLFAYEAKELFDNDPGRKEIMRQILKVKNLSIPKTILIEE